MHVHHTTHILERLMDMVSWSENGMTVCSHVDKQVVADTSRRTQQVTTQLSMAELSMQSGSGAIKILFRCKFSSQTSTFARSSTPSVY